MNLAMFANFVGCVFAAISSGAFILVWSIVGNWWKTSIGRFMIIKAAALFVASFLSAVLYVMMELTNYNPPMVPLLYLQTAIWLAVSVAFVHHTYLFWSQRKDTKK